MKKHFLPLTLLMLLLLGCKSKQIALSETNTSSQEEVIIDSLWSYSSEIMLPNADVSKSINILKNPVSNTNSIIETEKIGRIIKGIYNEFLGVELIESGKSSIQLKNGETVETVSQPISSLISSDLKTVIKLGPYNPDNIENNGIYFYNNGAAMNHYDSVKMIQKAALSENGFLTTVQRKRADSYSTITQYSSSGNILWIKHTDSERYISHLFVSKNGNYIGIKECGSEYEMLKIFDNQATLIYSEETTNLYSISFSSSGNYLTVSERGITRLIDLRNNKPIWSIPNFLYSQIPNNHIILENHNIIVTAKVSTNWDMPSDLYMVSFNTYDINTGKLIESFELPGIHSFKNGGFGFSSKTNSSFQFLSDQSEFSIYIK